jgi:hypothetical protein
MDMKITTEELKKKSNNGNDKRIDMDEIRYNDWIDAQIDQYRNKGKPTLQDMMAIQQLEDMRWERRQRMKAETQSSSTPQIDIEEIIRKAQEPLQKQLEEMKRAQEKAEEEKRWENIQRQIDKLTELIVSGGSMKKSDDDNPIMKQLIALQSELKDEKEKARKKEEETFRESIKNMIYDLSDRISEIKEKPEKTQTEIEQMINLEKKKSDLLRALGVKPEKGEDDASVMDVVDSLADKVPKWAKTAATVRDVFSKDSEIPDDVPEDVPTNLPQRNVPTPARSSIPDDIKSFLDRGYDKDGTYVDYTGTPWINLEGNPISRKDIEDLAITNPEDVRRLMRETDEAFKQKQEKGKQEKSDTDVLIKSRIHTAPKPPESPEPPTETKKEEEEVKEPEPEEPEEPEEPNPTLQEALRYIQSGSDVDDPEGHGKIWVGAKNEFYTNDDGKPATSEDLRAMAQEDPEQFMQDVREHLKSLETQEDGE